MPKAAKKEIKWASKEKKPVISRDLNWFGLVPSKYAVIAWGARLVSQRNQWAAYPDRQQWNTKEHPRKKEMIEWINQQLEKKNNLWNEEVLTFHEGDRHFQIYYRGGYGYCVAWIE